MKTRNYGIDFLRMISMIMIVMLHTLGHGGILRSVSFLSVHYQIAWLLEVIAFGAVNTYAMISGFVSVDSHFKISNILILWLQVLFYGILINTVFFFLLPESRNTSGWIQALFPVTRKEYWYFTAYAGVFFLSPFINQMFRNLSEKQIKTLFCFTLVVFSVVPTISQTFTPQQDVFYMGDGYSVFWLTLMYLLGACIKKLNLVSHSKKKKYFILYFFCILITWSSKILVEKFPISGFTLDSSFLIHYTSPFIVLAADIAYRMAALKPQLLGNVCRETDGVVLIDEVDLHLHPTWQQRILGDLTEIFPKVQFIVSTHAPAVINTVKSENIILLDDGMAYEPSGEVHGKDTNTIISGIMHS